MIFPFYCMEIIIYAIDEECIKYVSWTVHMYKKIMVLFNFVYVDSSDSFTNIIQGWFTGSVAILQNPGE